MSGKALPVKMSFRFAGGRDRGCEWETLSLAHLEPLQLLAALFSCTSSTVEFNKAVGWSFRLYILPYVFLSCDQAKWTLGAKLSACEIEILSFKSLQRSILQPLSQLFKVRK